MAKIKTDRPEAAAFNGRTCEFVHDVTPLDGAAFDKDVDQTIVRLDGRLLYFFANEVELTDEEKASAQKHADKAKEALSDSEKASKDNDAAKAKMHGMTKRDAKPTVAAKPDVPPAPPKPAMAPAVVPPPANPPAS